MNEEGKIKEGIVAKVFQEIPTTQYEKVKSLLYYSYGHYHKRIANNTHLTLENEGLPSEHVEMKLHGNIITTFYREYITISDGGWATNRTKNALNLALHMASINIIIRQKKWRWYLHKGIMSMCFRFGETMKISYGGEYE